MSEIHTKKYLEENPEAASADTSATTSAATHTESSSFFSGFLFKVILVLVILGGIFGYAYFQAKKVFVDNPSKQAITVKINGKEYSVEPLSSTVVNIGFGKHKVEVIGDTEAGGEFERNFSFDFDSLMKLSDIAFGKYDVVNPLLYPYFIDHAIYGGSTTNAIMPKVPSDLYIPNTWDYGLNEPFPEQISVSRRGNSGPITKKKIYRFSDFAKEQRMSEESLLRELYGDDIFEEQ